ncbi:MAG TPA: RICIN domain-containing protein [Trebonia sp.]
MGYKARHAEPSALVKVAARGGAIASAAAIVAAGAGAIAPGVASAATTPLSVTLSHSADASAAYDLAGDPVLTVGPDSSTTYAKVTVNGVSGTAAPSEEPTFKTSNYNAGSPRWVINFANGYWIQSDGASTADTAWTANGPGGFYKYGVTYSAALGDVGASHSTVTSAYIVADGDQTSGTQDVLTGVQYNGQTIAGPEAVFIGPISNVNSGKCLDVTNASGTFKAGQGLQQWTCGAAGGEDQQFTLTTERDGTQYLTVGSGSSALYVTATTQGQQLKLESAPVTVNRSGSYYKFEGGKLVMDVTGRSKLNGAVVQGYAQQATNNANQQWSLPS